MGHLEEMFGLAGKKAFVTGGAQGIGKALAVHMAKCGMDVAIVDVKKEKAEAVAHEIENLGVKALVIQADVTSEADVEKMMATVMAEFQRIDVALNNAGIVNQEASEDVPYDHWKRVIDVNLNGIFLTARAAGREMIKQKAGSIINTASMSGHIVNRPQPQSSYNASKAGVILLTKSLAVEWAKYNVRVNCISPGYIATELTIHLRKEWLDSWIEQSVMPTLGTPDNLVAAVLYLASDAAPFTTGTDIVIDGGFTSV